jgi:queuine tRNA-ribosyltransferase
MRIGLYIFISKGYNRATDKRRTDMYKLIKKDGNAKRGEFHTVHGVIQTPVFMNVGTVAAIKGAVSTEDLEQIKTQVELSNTYHLHVRPGDQLIKELGGLHKFMVWDKPILTDSGGFQVFSLATLRKIKEEGVYFHSHVDGRKIFMGPEESMQIQSNLASTIAMAFDECPSSVAERSYVENSVARTTRWLERCKKEMARLNSLEDTINKNQMLFGINQGAIFEDIRIDHAKRIAEMDLDGYAIGGLAVGESHEEMYHIIEAVVQHLPVEKPTYLMGVGTPANILEGVERGVDFFDCVYPTRNGRHGHLYTNQGKINLFNKKYEKDMRPIEEGCQCPACRRYSRAYIRHLLKAKEMLGMRLCVLHNLYFYNTMMEEIRDAIEKGAYQSYKEEKLYGMGQLTSGISKGDL